ncbi:MAG: HAMP domain-containing sensor histidine kinase, partial [Patescibacteria group bacterium]
SAISWYAEMLLSGEIGMVNAKQKEYLESLYEANRRMIELVNALLNVSRVDLGTFTIEPEPCDLAALADGVIAELLPAISHKKIELKKNYDPSLGSVSVDPKLTRIIFQNLLSNAVKYTPTGGTVTFYLLKEEGDVLCRVTDTGYGIPSADRTKIFTKLFRSDNVKDKEAEGTGLGLYIIKSIITAAGGSVSFDSLEGQGTTFTVRVPLSGMIKKQGTKELS